MASKPELAAAIKEVDPMADTDGLSHAELTALLSEVRTPDPRLEAPETETEAPAAAPYSIADGKAITTLRGVMTEGMPIEAGDFAGGQAALDNMVDKKYIDKA